MSLKSETVTTAVCPHCNKADSTVDHLLDSNTTTCWYCDNCGGRYRLEFGGGGCAISQLQEWCIDLAVVLQYKDAFVVVKGLALTKGDRSSYDATNLEYLYNQHTCPVNWLGVECLFDAKNKDADPHGMFVFVGFEVYPEGAEDCNFDWVPLINRIRKTL